MCWSQRRRWMLVSSGCWTAVLHWRRPLPPPRRRRRRLQLPPRAAPPPATSPGWVGNRGSRGHYCCCSCRRQGLTAGGRRRRGGLDALRDLQTHQRLHLSFQILSRQTKQRKFKLFKLKKRLYLTNT